MIPGRPGFPYFLVLVLAAGLFGSALYEQGAPAWLVYVFRHLIYEVGR